MMHFYYAKASNKQSTRRVANTGHLHNIDLCKGVLVLLVVVGHVLRGSLEESLPRALIYSFHMPLFIGISGFLFYSPKLSSLSLHALIARLTFRVIVPWVIAVVVYFFVFGLLGNGFSYKNFIMSFLMPSYHLWFIPAYITWLVLTWVLVKLNIKIQRLALASVPVSVLFFVADRLHFSFSNHYLDSLFQVFLYDVRPYFYMFFVFGMWLRSGAQKLPDSFGILLLLLLAVLDVYAFIEPALLLKTFVFVGLNLVLLYQLLKWAVKGNLPGSPLLEWIGINSLSIYLWHVIPILIAEKLLAAGQINSFYMPVLIGEFATIVAFHFLSKVSLVNQYLLGNVNRRNTGPG